MAETKIIYHIDEEETPYLVKIQIPAENITLLDFKQVLNKPNYKFFFKSMDQDFGFSSSTEQSSASRLLKRHRRRRKQRPPRLERTSSFSSVTDSTMSLNIITVTLNMEKYNFLGISIVGQSNERGDGGIYIGSIMKGGAVAADGRIEPGDMLLQVNDINFENMSNDDAVRVLREIVHKPGPIILTVAKCWDPSPQGYFTLPRSFDDFNLSLHSDMASVAKAMASPESGLEVRDRMWLKITIPNAFLGFDDFNLSLHSDMASVAKAMASPESGLEVRDRMWLKITIPNAFLGTAVLSSCGDRRESRKYASNLLKAGFIRHTVNKITFSEQCYYIFGDFSDCENYMANLSLNDNDGSSGASDQDTLAPLPGATPWPMMHTFPYQYPHPYSSQPPPYHELASYSYGPGSNGSQHSEGKRITEPLSPLISSELLSFHSLPSCASEHSQRSHLSYGPPGIPLSYNPMMVMMLPQPHPPPHPHPGMLPPASGGPPGAPPVRDLASVPPELTASRQSFHLAMGNPSEFFVDVM
ncbi:UNVERIFIED_CONTAM: hypothetical protein FKN15_010941 [Acipenser sinensis]